MHDPVGLDGRGVPYPVEIPLAERLRPLAERGFRDVAGRLLYVRGVAELVRMGGRGASGRRLLRLPRPRARPLP